MNGPRKALQGLTAPLKERLIQEALQRRMRKTELERSAPVRTQATLERSEHVDSIPDCNIRRVAQKVAVGILGNRISPVKHSQRQKSNK